MDNKVNVCQLCGNEGRAGIDIFGTKGKKLSIKSIIFQHFSLAVTETDNKLKIVCKKCWKITNNFHQLYCLTRDVFTSLNPDKKSLIRISPVPNEPINMQQPDYAPVEVKLEAYDYNSFEKDLPSHQPNHFEQQSDISIKEENYQQIVDSTGVVSKPRIDKNSVKCTRNYLTRSRSTTKISTTLTKRELEIIEKDNVIRNLLGFVCELCGENFSNFWYLNKHIRREHKVRGFVRCCNRKFRYRSLIYGHIIEKHKNPIRQKCSICTETFFQDDCPRKHIKYDSMGRQSFQCPNCPKSFRDKSYLKKHFEWVHSTGPISFICDICGKSYISKVAITCHLLSVHVRKNAQICDICGITFKTMHLLDAHNKIKHLGIELPKVQCNICDSWLSSKHVLRKHMSNHYAKEETCLTCGKKAPNRNALTTHIRKEHSGEIFQCSMCDKQLKSEKALKEHVATHTGYNLYKCNYCEKEFKYGCNLYRHRKHMHSKEWEEEQRGKSYQRFIPLKKVKT